MKILLTGSSGFIGQAITKRLEKIYDVHHLSSDLTHHNAVKNEVVKADPDIIVHLAARTEVEKSFYEQITFSEINYVGTVNLIETALQLPKLKNFIFASTMEVFGWQPISDEIKNNLIPQKLIAFDEHTPVHPSAPYAVAKRGCELYLEYAHRSLGLPFTAIRQTNAYGRHDNDFFVTEQIINQMLYNPNEIRLGYGEPYRNFIYIEDLLDAWMAIIENPNKVNNGRILTVGPDNAIKIKDYVKKIADKMGWNGKVLWNTKPERPGEIYLLNSNHNLITELLGWKPKVSLDEGLQETINIWEYMYKENLHV